MSKEETPLFCQTHYPPDTCCGGLTSIYLPMLPAPGSEKMVPSTSSASNSDKQETQIEEKINSKPLSKRLLESMKHLPKDRQLVILNALQAKVERIATRISLMKPEITLSHTLPTSISQGSKLIDDEQPDSATQTFNPAKQNGLAKVNLFRSIFLDPNAWVMFEYGTSVVIESPTDSVELQTINVFANTYPTEKHLDLEDVGVSTLDGDRGWLVTSRNPDICNIILFDDIGAESRKDTLDIASYAKKLRKQDWFNRLIIHVEHEMTHTKEAENASKADCPAIHLT